MTEIRYKDGVIATVAAGGLAKLLCRCKRVERDVVVNFGSAGGSIEYDGIKIQAAAGQTVTLRFAGKIIKTDVVINDGVTATGGRLITSDGYAVADINGNILTIKEG